MDLQIKIADLKVSEITTTSGIFSGENYHAHWSAISKSNTGLNLGDSSLSTACINMVYDPDFIGLIKTSKKGFQNRSKVDED
ncbi:MAG TPA: hypothetical protein VF531_16070 [Bacillota bacterium]